MQAVAQAQEHRVQRMSLTGSKKDKVSAQGALPVGNENAGSWRAQKLHTLYRLVDTPRLH
jgi:hypothetical protein